MNPNVLLLRLEGPLQSWGLRARWDVRDTHTEPTKSGIVGLLACALGYPKGDPRMESQLYQGLLFGVRVDKPGNIRKDYQTVSGFLPTAEGSFKHSGVQTAKKLTILQQRWDAVPATIVTPHYYLEDASFLAALQERPTHSGIINECSEALRNPKWPLFLGRKCCIPSLPIRYKYTNEYSSLLEALRSEPISEASKRKIGDKLRVYFDSDLHDYSTTSPHSSIQDVPLAGPTRLYGFRFQGCDEVEVPQL